MNRQFGLFLIALCVAAILLYFSQKIKEPFLQSYCFKFKSCRDCASSSGCSWCPKESICLPNSALRTTDENCNQNNTISSVFRCRTATEGTAPSDNTHPTMDFTDESIWEPKIENAPFPPNVGVTEKNIYSRQDLVSNMNEIRNSINNFKTELPGIIATTVDANIKPMFRGLLVDNYVIQGFQPAPQGFQSAQQGFQPAPQGFQDMRRNNGCTEHKSCEECTADNHCGWYKASQLCKVRGENAIHYITNPGRCREQLSSGSHSDRPFCPNFHSVRKCESIEGCKWDGQFNNCIEEENPKRVAITI